jgi:hypothetical protein
VTAEVDHLLKIAVLETEVKNLKEAIKLQALEYERRLAELNHAHAQAVSDKNKFMTSELFYSKYDEIAKWRSELDQWRSRIVGIAIGIGSVSGLIGGVIAALVARSLK